ncbi:hypothetical protein BN2476_200011 [Paraburkholderia piptadeniae]|uniref:Uncharacterized protein n=1 Tax=Paraburkholderia piptadeniae TaxID=1701573 RepID=A0A1N7RUR7_9BURK|nr:hypothetical protein BN2476_200011 [Paraburkholderia piptadeniae]
MTLVRAGSLRGTGTSADDMRAGTPAVDSIAQCTPHIDMQQSECAWRQGEPASRVSIEASQCVATTRIDSCERIARVDVDTCSCSHADAPCMPSKASVNTMRMRESRVMRIYRRVRECDVR